MVPRALCPSLRAASQFPFEEPLQYRNLCQVTPGTQVTRCPCFRIPCVVRGRATPWALSGQSPEQGVGESSVGGCQGGQRAPRLFWHACATPAPRFCEHPPHPHHILLGTSFCSSRVASVAWTIDISWWIWGQIEWSKAPAPRCLLGAQRGPASPLPSLDP